MTTYLFGLTLFLSAALMFAVQPMAGKMLLPLVGGAPAGWIAAMAFFQVMLLAGYLLAHLLSRFSPRAQALLFCALLGLGVFLLPFYIRPGDADAVAGAWRVFQLLFAAIGLPFVALSAASSTLQRLFTVTGRPSAQDPYFLYAASNLGSFCGLLLYPLAAEPLLGLSAQSTLWFQAYAGVICLSLLCVAATRPAGAPAAKKEEAPLPPEALTNRQRLRWLALAFVPSALMMAVTTHVTTDIFSAPMFWVLPLGLYLLTFVVAFSRRNPFPLHRVAAIHVVLACAGVGMLLLMSSFIRLAWYGLLLQLVVFTATALMCHMRLAALRPPDSRRHLTEFYLFLSIGGALGGVLSAFILPHLLDRLIEYPVLLILSLLLNPDFEKRISFVKRMFFGLALFCMLIYAGQISRGDMTDPQNYYAVTPAMTAVDMSLCLVVLLLATNARAAFYGLSILFLLGTFILPQRVLLTERNFFGIIKVFESPMLIDGKRYTARYMNHGTTLHGLQVTDPAYRRQPTTYFTESGPIGNVFQIYNPGRPAVLGLGIGTLACYAAPGSRFTFIEIDPAVADVARDHFTFLDECGQGEPPRIILGDGRIEMQRLKDESFDLIVLDAFSSDTIPTHLITLEALEIYLDRLTPRGIIAVNISNRYFNLAPVLIRNAAELGLHVRIRQDIAQTAPYAAYSLWLTIAREDATLAPLEDFDWHRVKVAEDLRPWTDDYTNLLRMLAYRL